MTASEEEKEAHFSAPFSAYDNRKAVPIMSRELDFEQLEEKEKRLFRVKDYRGRKKVTLIAKKAERCQQKESKA